MDGFVVGGLEDGRMGGLVLGGEGVDLVGGGDGCRRSC